MSYNDGIADLITRIRNAYLAGRTKVLVRRSKINLKILQLLKDDGYLHNFEDNEYNPYTVIIKLRYKNSRPAVNDITRVSKPGRRVYTKIENLPRYYSGYATVILSTSQGVMPGYEAKEKNIGGEVLFYVF